MLSTIYKFFYVSGCVGMSPTALLCPGASDVNKTALSVVLVVFFHFITSFEIYLYIFCKHTFTHFWVFVRFIIAI